MHTISDSVIAIFQKDQKYFRRINTNWIEICYKTGNVQLGEIVSGSPFFQETVYHIVFRFDPNAKNGPELNITYHFEDENRMPKIDGKTLYEPHSIPVSGIEEALEIAHDLAPKIEQGIIQNGKNIEAIKKEIEKIAKVR